jgi:hypothetical protein
LALALIKRDRYDRVFSIHRLIAAKFRRFLNPKDRQKAFFEASILLHNAFPKRQKEPGVARANLYNVWDKCQVWLQHVLKLKSSFMQERKRDPSFSACKETCETWVQCQRLVKIAQMYQPSNSFTISFPFPKSLPVMRTDTAVSFLLETQNWRELEDLVTANKIAMATLSEPAKEIYLLSSTEIHVASMWAFRGRFKMALESLLTAYSLKLTESPIDLQNTCWIEDNLASIYGCLGDFSTAIEWIERSRATWKRWSQLTGVEFMCPPLLKLTHGRILTHGGRLGEARVQLTEAIDGLLSAEPFVWAPTAT